MANHTPAEAELGFEPDVHFVEFDLASFNAGALGLLGNPARRRAISDAARELISQRHTWRHRVQQIVTDLQR